MPENTQEQPSLHNGPSQERLDATKQQTQKKAPEEDVPSPLSDALNLSAEKRLALDRIFEEAGLQNNRETIEASLIGLFNGKQFGAGRILNLDNKNTDPEKIVAVMDRITQEVLGQPDWPIPRLDLRSDPQSFETSKKIEMIVHPLYGILRGEQWDAKLWKESNGNITVYIQKQLVRAAEIAQTSLRQNPNAIPEAYLFLMEITQELHTMNASPPPDTLRVFVMPRRSLLSPDKQKAMSELLRPSADKNNVRVVDSFHDGTGQLTQDTTETLARISPFGAAVEVKGGYLGGCLDGCVQSLSELGRGDLPVSVDFDGGTAFIGVSPDDKRGSFQLEKTPKIIPPSTSLQTTDAIIQWVHQNDAFNKAYKDVLSSEYQKTVPKGIKVTQAETSHQDARA